ncbi:MAG: Do family serine endopeptidase [Planctomycetales bacterium]|nr:Do family serine endopeptidase [Planctomycetales bacterium]
MKTNFKKRMAWAAASLALLASVGWAATEVERPAAATHLAPLTQMSPEVEQAIESANNLSTAFRTVANRLLPAVVAIENRPAIAQYDGFQAQPSQGGIPGGNPFEGTPFEDLFRGRDFRMQPPGGMGRTPSVGGIGSGVVISTEGIILTNNHVVAGGGEVTVKTSDGREFIASNVWTDPKTDLAVVKIDGASDLIAAPLGDSDQVEIGDWVVALGQPFGLESTVTAGIISAKNRGLGITDRENFLQTDAAINPGNSGGPLVNLRGEVIGINTAISSRSGGNEGIGFAVPSNLARWVSDQLVSEGLVRRAYLGVGIQPVSQALAKQLSVKPRSGVVVTEVFPQTPAAKAGLKTGDVIVKFNGRSVTDPQQLQLAVERSEFGKKLPIDIVRDGQPQQLSYEPEEQPGTFGLRGSNNSEMQQGKRMENFGMEVAPLDADVAEQLGMQGTEGVVITSVHTGGAASRAGLESGMVITHVNRQPVASLEEFSQAMESGSGGEGILLLVRTEAGSRFVVLK